jgi:hypothetical protein
MFQNIPKAKVLEVVKQGPTIPQKIVKQVGGDTMIVGAVLSTMISTGEVRYTSFKIGGSPVYYAPGDESKLEEFTNYLNAKDQKTVKMLKDQKVIRESVQDPLTRVSLKTVKDFARPFESEHNGNKELFYRYFLISQEEAELLASEVLKKREQLLEQELEEKRNAEQTIADTILEEKKQKESEEKKKQQELEEKQRQKIELEEKRKSEAVEEEKKKEQSVELTQEISEHKPEHSHTHKTKEEHKPSPSHEKHHLKKDFFESIVDKVHEMGLDIISKEKIKKTEYTLILKNHNSNEYHYAVAKDKKSINEGDLSTAFVFAHNKRMPCIFFMTGSLTKKAELMKLKEFKDIQIENL